MKSERTEGKMRKRTGGRRAKEEKKHKGEMEGRRLP